MDSTENISLALCLSPHAIGVIKLNRHTHKTILTHITESPITQPLLTKKNTSLLQKLIPSVKGSYPVHVSLDPQYVDIKILNIPIELSKTEYKKYLKSQLKPANTTYTHLESITEGKQYKKLLTTSIAKNLLKSIITLLKKCSLTAKTVLTTPIIIRELLPHTDKQQLFVFQKAHYYLGAVENNKLLFFTKISGEDNKPSTIVQTIAAALPNHLAATRIWLATENDSLIPLLEKVFALPVTRLQTLLSFTHGKHLSPLLLETALLAYRGLDAAL